MRNAETTYRAADPPESAAPAGPDDEYVVRLRRQDRQHPPGMPALDLGQHHKVRWHLTPSRSQRVLKPPAGAFAPDPAKLGGRLAPVSAVAAWWEPGEHWQQISAT